MNQTAYSHLLDTVFLLRGKFIALSYIKNEKRQFKLGIYSRS